MDYGICCIKVMHRFGGISSKIDFRQRYIFPLLFPNTSYRTLEFDKPLSTRMVWNIVARWGDYCVIGN